MYNDESDKYIYGINSFIYFFVLTILVWLKS